MNDVMKYRMIRKFLNFNNDTHKDALVTHKPKFGLQGLLQNDNDKEA